MTIPTSRRLSNATNRNRKRRWRRLPMLSFALFVLSAYTIVLFFVTAKTEGVTTEANQGWEIPRDFVRKVPLASVSVEEQGHQSQQHHDHRLENPVPMVRNLSSESLPSQTSRPPFGFVMRDFARRVLSRHISKSNVLVVASDSTSAAKYATTAANTEMNGKIYDTPDYDSPYSIGGTFLLHAAAQDHTIHAIDAGVDKDGNGISSNRTLDDWWSSFESDIKGDEKHWWSSSTDDQPKWIIAAMIDLEFGHEDAIWEGADKFLQESTVTYLVVAMHSRKDQGGYQFGGLGAASVLLSRRYKLQTLMVSHYDADPGDEASVEEQFGPNALFKSTDHVKEFLSWGADAAYRYGGGTDSVFTAYVFATQGLDLAIPSTRVFLHDSTRVIGVESTTQVNLYKPLQFKLCPQTEIKPKLGLRFERLLGETSIRVNIAVDNSTDQVRHYHRKAPPNLGFTYQYKADGTHSIGPKPKEVLLWHNGEDLNTAEAACARLHDFTKCTTRIVENKELKSKQQQSDKVDRPNILLVMLDPMSRPHFERSMPMTTSTLEKLGFIHFPNYTAVGNNSGPNQAALYSGTPLANRDGIKHDTGGEKWLWDRLQDDGYITMKAEDGCIENSNMLQRLEPNTTHGQALQKLFCFDFDRPNCLGPELAATHLLQYGEQFVDTYEHRRQKIDPNLRWAAFMHFIDSHEDTMVLSSVIDHNVSNFLEKLDEDQKLDETIVIFCSDHGLHYGSYFQSRSGRREATQPLLYIRVPPYIQSKLDMGTFVSNARAWTTPYDVHETLVMLTSGKNELAKKNRKGISLFEPLPHERASCEETAEIPDFYCDLYAHTIHTEESCTKMPQPPNVLSFFADVPLTQRPKLPFDCKAMQNATASDVSKHTSCQCATSHREWYRCVEHPWGVEGIKSNTYPEEYFALVKCRGKKMSVDTRVVHQDVNSRKNQQKDGQAPNILFIEVDSASTAYADRHFPMTRSLLKTYRLKGSPGGDVECTNGICAADFSLFSLVGPNSVGNQISALSGCLVTRFHNSCFPDHNLREDKCSAGGMFSSMEGDCQVCPKGTFLRDPLSHCPSSNHESCCQHEFPNRNETRICSDESRFEHGLQLFRRGPRRHTTWCSAGEGDETGAAQKPWIFDLAKANGYTTFFGDEFCYEGSPFVAQDNVFPLSPDFELHRLYCRLQECRQYKFEALGPRICARQKTNSNDDKRESLDTPGLDLIDSLWDAYPTTPKFAYLNAMAPHDYSPEWTKMAAVAEEYDEKLATFLSSIFARESFQNTLIIVRADHGLQGGPSTLEYSMQVEHREPWTQMIVPQTLVGSDALKTLYSNQNKIATGFDLYRTLREVISTEAINPPVPKWSYNLLHSRIPSDRSCVDAKVPLDFCPCEEQVLDRPPSFGVCNPFDQYGDLFCLDKNEVILPDILEL